MCSRLSVEAVLGSREDQLRRDGRLRADAKASSPAARVAFDSTHGELAWATDAFTVPAYVYEGSMHQSWQHNVYAIAKSMEALRAVDRYGTTRRNQQYTGFLAIEAGSGAPFAAPAGMTTTVAAELLRSFGVAGDSLESCKTAALRTTHPDRGGHLADFQRVNDAIRVLKAAGSLT